VGPQNPNPAGLKSFHQAQSEDPEKKIFSVY